MRPPRRVCVMGVSGAGKTVVGTLLAERLAVPFLEGDLLHPPENVDRMAQGIPLTDDDRGPWLAAVAARIAEARAQRAGLVVACSALKRQYRDVLRGADPDLVFVHLSGNAALIRQRMGQRADHYMPATLLDSQLATLEVPGPDEHALTCDVIEAPELIVTHIVQRLDR